MKKQFHLFVILLTVFLSVFSFANRSLIHTVGATYVEGPITQDTTWTLVDSPFVVSKDVRVYSNATLTIEPGVEVRFGGDFSIVVSGRLYADGVDKTITFTSNKGQPDSGDWKSIRFNGTQMSTLIGCSIVYAEDGIVVENGDVEIENSTVSLCSYNGINITDSDVLVQNSMIAENQGNGIYVTGTGQVTIQENTIIANGNGILLTGDDVSNVNITQNKISANTQNGIQIDAKVHTNITILYNTISSNDEGFYVSSSMSTSITNNSISYNNIGILYDKGSHSASYNDIYSNEMGMDVLANATVNAEYNYWGDPSGPYHELLNPRGKGNPVGGDGVNLDFIFFLTKPVGYINSRPSANLQVDKIWIRPNDIVMFFATDLYDDGRIDKYFFEFGDGSNSGWTTLSTFTHKYSSDGIYYPQLRVMDDFGATSIPAAMTVYVDDLPSLRVSLEISSFTVHEGEQVSATVYVSNGTAAVENAAVTLFSVRGGEFTNPSGPTNASGYFTTTFTAPDVTDITNVRIVARASKGGTQFTDGSDYEYLEVSPSLSVQITLNPDAIKSEGTAQVVVLVESNEQPVTNASVRVLSDAGSLSLQTGMTDSNGQLSLTFIAPQTTTLLGVNITATATKSGYVDGVGQTLITVQPKVLDIEVVAESTVTISEGKLNVTTHVEYETAPITGVNVTMMANDGEFSTTTGLTDAYGNVTIIFTAPQVNEQTKITITAQARLTGYAEAQDQLEITVNPRTFNVQIIASTVQSGEYAIVTVYSTCNEDGTSVADATVTVSCSDGNFDSVMKTTDSTGTCTFVFVAPHTTADLSVTMTANVTKNGYTAGGNQTTITVTKAVPQGDGGWLLTAVLLIVIPVVIVIIVLVLIKLRVIVISAGEET